MTYMRILMPFWNLDIFDRFFPQMKVISERINEFHIAYIFGEPQNEWCKYFIFHKVQLKRVPFKSKTVRWWLSRRGIKSSLRDVEVDLHYCLSGFWTQELSRYCSEDKPYVIRLRGDYLAYMESIGVPLWKKVILSHLWIASFKNADLIIPISSKLRQKAINWGVPPDKISDLIPNGVDTSLFRPMKIDKEDVFVIGYAGRLSPEKGIDRLIRLAKTFPNIRFLVAGSKQTAISFSSNIRYLGYIPHSRMANFYNSCDLIILPSYTEGFPCVLLEAYACGKPVLATPESFPAELKVYGSVAHFSSWPQKIQELMKMDLTNLGKEARDYVQKHFSWEHFGDRIVKKLETVLP